MPATKIGRLLGRIAERPDNASLHQLLGKLYRAEGDLARMEAAWEESLRLDPCDAWTHLFLGNMYYGREDWPNALERFEYAAMLMPDDPCPLWCIADVFEAQGRQDLAEEYHRKAVDVDPDDEQASRMMEEWQERRSSTPGDSPEACPGDSVA